MNYLKCPHCDNKAMAEEILSSATTAFPELSWIYAQCKRCKQQYHVALEAKKMHSIVFLGAPGPQYKQYHSIDLNDLSVRIDPGFLHCWLGNIHYEFQEQK